MSYDPSSPEGRLARLIGFIEHDPDNQALLVDALTLAIELKQEQESSRLIEHVGTLAAASPVAYAYAAHLSLKLSRFSDAGDLGDRAIAGGVNHPSVIYNAALGHYYTGDFERAALLLKPMADADEGSRDVINVLIRSLHQLERTEEAQPYAERACRAFPDDVRLRGLLALIQYENDDNTSALLNAQEVLSQDPDQLEALIACASAHFEEGSVQPSRKAWLHAVEVHPECGRAWSGLAQLEFHELEFEQAEVHLKEAVGFMPDHIGTWHLLAWIYILKSDSKQARQALEASYALDRNFGETHGGIAVVDAMDGETEKARFGIRKALKLNPDGLAAQYAELILMQKAGRAEEANRLVKGVLERKAQGAGVSGTVLVRKWLEHHQGVEKIISSKSNQ
jgi:tetratricopeptide (TPR) repeat protein